MSRISIVDVTKDQHKRLKALAALRGVSLLRIYLLENALDSGHEDEDKTLAELESFLDDRPPKGLGCWKNQQTKSGRYF